MHATRTIVSSPSMFSFSRIEDLEYHLAMNKQVNAVPGNYSVLNTPEFLGIAKQQMDIIHEEVMEAHTEFSRFEKDGFSQEMYKLLRDGLGDTIVTYYGLFARLCLEFNIPSIDFDSITIDDVTSASREERLEFASLLFRTQLLPSHSLTMDLVRTAQHTGDLDLPLIQRLAESIVLLTDRISRIVGVDVIADQEAIFASNMSKFDTDPIIAEQGLQKYLDNGVKAAVYPNEVDGVEYHVIKVAEDCTVVINGKSKNFVKGKFLKSILFAEPKLPSTIFTDY